jgi:signal transduction histidine kinase
VVGFATVSSRTYSLFSFQVLCIVLIAHAAAAVLCILSLREAGVASAYVYQFVFFLAFSVAATVAEFALPYRAPTRIVLAAHLCVVLLLTVQLPAPKEVDYLVLLSFVMQIAIYEAFPWSLVFSSIAVIASTIGFFPLRADSGVQLTAVLPEAVFFLVVGLSFATAATLMVKYRREKTIQERRAEDLGDTISRLMQANIGFQKYASEVEERSVRGERMRVSRDLHDTVGSTLTNLIMMMDTLEAMIQIERTSKALDIARRARDQVEQGLEQTRASLHELRQVKWPEVKGLQAVHKLVRVFEDIVNVDVHVEYGNVRSNLGNDVENVLYMVVREGLTNAFRHGKASRIKIILFQHEEKLILTIRDNGEGAEEVKEGIGLAGMRERIGRFGGHLYARNVVDGFELQVILTMPYSSRPSPARQTDRTGQNVPVWNG